MKAPCRLLLLLLQLQLLTVLSLVVCRVSADDHINLSVLDVDLSRSRTDGGASRSAQRSVVKRATLDEQSRPSAVEHTLNSLRRLSRAANIYYVVRYRPICKSVYLRCDGSMVFSIVAKFFFSVNTITHEPLYLAS